MVASRAVRSPDAMMAAHCRRKPFVFTPRSMQRRAVRRIRSSSRWMPRLPSAFWE